MVHKSASTVVSALYARSAVVHQYVSTVVSALSARSAVVHKSASTVVGALRARSAVGLHQSASPRRPNKPLKDWEEMQAEMNAEPWRD